MCHTDAPDGGHPVPAKPLTIVSNLAVLSGKGHADATAASVFSQRLSEVFNAKARRAFVMVILQDQRKHKYTT